VLHREATCSPALLYNIDPDSSVDEATLITLHSVTSWSQAPSLPIAISITLARIASPLSIDPEFQDPAVHALRAYFGGGKQLVRLGDIIAIRIDADVSSAPDERLLPDGGQFNREE
jgi:peroxin-6